MILYTYVILSIIIFAPSGMKFMSLSNRTKNLFNEVDTCECGDHIEFTPRIVGGFETNQQFYPWMVAVFYNGRMHCGGSLINDRYILTAGHCLKGIVNKTDMSVVFDLQDRHLMETEGSGGVMEEIDKLVVHENFSSNDVHDVYDLGLMKLRNPVALNKNRTPVCLPKNGGDFSNANVTVLGWGRTSESGEAANRLRSTDLKVLTQDECKNINILSSQITDDVLCAYKNEADACWGDSGGPLIFETPSGKMHQIGVVSWGIGCASPGIPGIYVRTHWYLDWIARHTNDANYCK